MQIKIIVNLISVISPVFVTIYGNSPTIPICKVIKPIKSLTAVMLGNKGRFKRHKNIAITYPGRCIKYNVD